jgi:preprotein translocase subunit SecE
MAADEKISSSSNRTSPIRSASIIWDELKKVTWPTRREAVRLTILVLIISGVIGAILSLIDMGFAELFKILTEG